MGKKKRRKEKRDASRASAKAFKAAAYHNRDKSWKEALAKGLGVWEDINFPVRYERMGQWIVGLEPGSTGTQNLVCDQIGKVPDGVTRMRDWGRLTGTGHGGLALDGETAEVIQDMRGEALTAMVNACEHVSNPVGLPELIEAVEKFLASCDDEEYLSPGVLFNLRSAFDKLKGPIEPPRDVSCDF